MPISCALNKVITLALLRSKSRNYSHSEEKGGGVRGDRNDPSLLLVEILMLPVFVYLTYTQFQQSQECV